MLHYNYGRRMISGTKMKKERFNELSGVDLFLFRSEVMSRFPQDTELIDQIYEELERRRREIDKKEDNIKEYQNMNEKQRDITNLTRLILTIANLSPDLYYNDCIIHNKIEYIVATILDLRKE